ncbi:MAG: hypothetical protein KDB23_29150, partial [Planctomycetales bacterium]|nr:hypothetical protein [Planctomycetales bacterium]
LQIGGGYRIGGATKPQVFSIDGDITWEQAADIYFVPIRRSGYATLSTHVDVDPQIVAAIDANPNTHDVKMAGTPWEHVEVRDDRYKFSLTYQWYSGADTSDYPLAYKDAAYWEVSVDGGDNWWTSLELEPCARTCTVQIPYVFGTEPTMMRVRKTSPASAITVEGISAWTQYAPTSASFSLTVAAGELLQLYSHPLKGYASRTWLEDADGALVTNSASFQLRGPQEGAATYVLHLETSDVPEEINISRRSAQDDVDYYNLPHVRVDDTKITVSSWMAIDQRSCELQDISWDGPALTELRIDRSNLELSFDENLPPGMYTLTIAPGRCVTTLGFPVAPTPVSIDAIPPQLLEFPLEERRWLPTHDAGLLLYFDETFNSWQYEPVSSVRLSRDGIAIPFDGDTNYRLQPNSLYWHFGDLVPGEYRIEVQDISIFDVSGNAFTLPHFDFEFTVSEFPPDVRNLKFDLDLNGVVDERDLYFLVMGHWEWVGYQVERCDLNGDGEIDEADMTAWLRDAWDHPPGDVDFDGDFDEQDLALLSTMSYSDRTLADWQHGDFNGDGRFTNDDLILAMQFGLNIDAVTALDHRRTLPQA